MNPNARVKFSETKLENKNIPFDKEFLKELYFLAHKKNCPSHILLEIHYFCWGNWDDFDL